jgi:hypothetical protein
MVPQPTTLPRAPGMDIYIHIFLTSALVGGEWSASRPVRFTPGERAPGTHSIGGWGRLRAGLDDVGKKKFLTLPGLELRPFLYCKATYSLCTVSMLDLTMKNIIFWDVMPFSLVEAYQRFGGT